MMLETTIHIEVNG